MEIEKFEAEAHPALAEMESMRIADAEGMRAAAERLTWANRKLDALVEDREKITKPLNASLKEVRAKYKPLESALEAAISSLRSKMGGYQAKLVYERQEAEKKIAAKVESGYIRMDTAAGKIGALAPVESKVDSVTFVEKPDFEVISLSDLPLEYHLADGAAIRSKMKEGVELPGVRYFTVQVPRNAR